MTISELECLRATARRRRNLEQEILSLSRRLRECPDDASAYVRRGNAFRRKGQPIAALCDFNAAIRLHSWLADAWFYKAITCAALGYRLEEIRAHQRFLELTGGEQTDLTDGVRRRLLQLGRPTAA